MLILGIDPSLSGTGLAIISWVRGQPILIHHETIAHAKSDWRGAKLERIATRVTEVVSNFRPAHSIMETPFQGGYASATRALSEVRGAILMGWQQVFGGSLAPPEDIAPTEMKKRITGRGTASKAEVGAAVQRLLRLDAPLPENAADAAGCALAHPLLHPAP